MDIETIDTLLTTTRSVRKRLDFSRPVAPEVIERCLEIAMQAPTGSNRQHWSFLVLTDATKRAQISELYRKSFMAYAAGKERTSEDVGKLLDSATYLAENMQRVPVLVIPCIEGRVERDSQEAQAALYGSILPATWSFMLALRARGLGSAWTTLHLVYEKEAAHILGIPPHVTQACLLPVACYTGTDFKPAPRQPSVEKTYWNEWGTTRGRTGA